MLRANVTALSVTLFLGLIAQQSPASIVGGNLIKLDRVGTLGGGGGGGEFRVSLKDNNDKTTSGNFSAVGISFCVEYSEYIALNTQFYVGDTGGDEGVTSVWGGNDSNNDPGDRLSFSTENLFNLYASNSLKDENINGNLFAYNDTWANATQQAIWYLEEERSWSQIGTNARDLVNWINAKNYSSFSGNVKVLNLFSTNADYTKIQAFDADLTSTWDGLYNYRKQDQLFYNPLPPGDNGNPVPEPATFAMWGAIGLIGFGARRVYKKRKQTA